jgi:hypothetical protein
MKSLGDIITVILGAVALVTLVYAKDGSAPMQGVRSAVELIGHRTQASFTSRRTAMSRVVSTNDWATP